MSLYRTHIGRWKLKPNKKCELHVIVHRNPAKSWNKIISDLVHYDSHKTNNPGRILLKVKNEIEHCYYEGSVSYIKGGVDLCKLKGNENDPIQPTYWIRINQTIPRNKLVREYFNETEWTIGCKNQNQRKKISVNIIEYGLCSDKVIQRDWVKLS